MPGGTSKKARGKHRLDKYYHLAKDQGYRSRAAFKLIQLNKKHGFLDDARAVLDLCAAPGGWLQVCAKHLPISARIIGVDLVSIKPVRGAKTFVDDITTTSCREKLHKESGGSLFDVVLHDGAPNVGGAFATEMYTQSALVLDSLRLATDFLRPEGTFVTKIFRSRDYTALLFAFRQLFARVDATKPQASRAASAEIFVVCSGYKAPAKIDPRLLDHRSLFQDLEAPPQVMGPDALLKKIGKKHRHRTGYEAGTSLLHKTVSAVSFIRCKDPMPLLASTSSIILDPSKLDASTEKMNEDAKGSDDDEDASDKEDSDDKDAPGRFSDAETMEFVLSHKESVGEVRQLCGDLQVLGRSEFKQLLRWRMKIRKDLEAAEKARTKELAEKGEGAEDGVQADANSEEEGPQEGTADERLIKEMEGVQQKEVADAKRSRRKRRELKKKAKIRLAQAAAVAGVGEEQDLGEDALFSLNIIKGSKALHSTGDADALDADTVAATLDAPNSDSELVSSDSEEDDRAWGSDEEAAAAARYDAMVDQQLDNAYESYLQRRHARDAIKAEKQKRSRLGDTGEEEAAAAAAEAAQGIAELPSQQGESGSEEDNEEGGGLLVDFGKKATADATTQQWFSQAIFQDEGLLTDEDMEDDDKHTMHAHKQPPQATAGAPKAKNAAAVAQADAHMDDDSEDDSADDSVDNSAAAHVPLAVLSSPGTSLAGSKADKAHPTLPPDSATQPLKPATNRLSTDPAQHAQHAEESDDEDDEAAIALLKGSAAQARGGAGAGGGGSGGELEVVPRDRDGNDSSDTEDEFASLDEHAQAEVRAMARKWLGGRKGELSLLDAAYNRYTFDDDALPRWFREDERRHMRPPEVVSRDELNAEKHALRAIDATSLKKVVEAKARKRRRVVKRLETARHKAEGIVEGEDMSLHRKASEISKLYAKAKAAGRDKRKGGAEDTKKMSRSARENAKRKGPPLDRRMIADKMKGAAKAITKGKRGGAKGRGGKGKGKGR